MYVHMFKLAFAFIHTCMTMYMRKFICIIQFIPLIHIFLSSICMCMKYYMYMPYMMFTMYNLVAL